MRFISCAYLALVVVCISCTKSTKQDPRTSVGEVMDIEVLQACYGGVFEEELSQAPVVIDSVRLKIEALFPEDSPQEQAELLAIVFPEMLRYSQLSDMMETTALELLYVSSGKEVADFSIGVFQMKPSFAEELTPHVERRDVLNSLKSMEGQLRYLHQFRKHLLQVQDLDAEPTPERVAFLATAYNAGMHHDRATILALQSRYDFPYGRTYEGEQYNYSDIAVTLWSTVCYQN